MDWFRHLYHLIINKTNLTCGNCWDWIMEEFIREEAQDGN